MKKGESKKTTCKDNKIDLENGWSLVKIEEPEELNKYCYFCDFNELTPHKHHIIRKCDGGKDNSNNKIPLCANHHELIHRRVYVLAFNPKTGLYFLVNKKTREVINPSKRQKQYKRKLPISSIKNSNNLSIEGDLRTKAVVSIDDFEKSRRIKQKRECQKNLIQSVQ